MWFFEHHEYWPMSVYYGPILFDFFGHAIRLRSFRYPLVVNPGVLLSGLVGEKKSEILKRLPAHAYPRTLLVDPKRPLPAFPASLPWVAKPDQGERGMGIRLLQTHDDWRRYHDRAPRPYLVQEFVAAPFEVGILFFRRGGEFHISSLGVKVRAEVTGDGKSNVRELVLAHSRYRRQFDRLTKLALPIAWQNIPALGEVVVLDEIRNHRRGAEFRDGRKLITPELSGALSLLIPESSGIRYGRADLRCPSAKDLSDGKNLSIVEVNGITGEPAEIYDPQMPFGESLKILRDHWDEIAKIAEEALSRGEKPPSWKALFTILWEWRKREEFFDH